MKTLAILAFGAGLALWVRVMFFGVRRVRGEGFHHRKWPLATATFLIVGGALLYARARLGPVTPGWGGMVVFSAGATAAAAWLLVQRSASLPSTDPEDDPRYQFQGHVATVVQPIREGEDGRVAFVFDGKRLEFSARWSPAATLPRGEESLALGAVGSEVVIEIIEGDVAYVEPWSLVEQRL